MDIRKKPVLRGEDAVRFNQKMEDVPQINDHTPEEIEAIRQKVLEKLKDNKNPS